MSGIFGFRGVIDPQPSLNKSPIPISGCLMLALKDLVTGPEMSLNPSPTTTLWIRRYYVVSELFRDDSNHHRHTTAEVAEIPSRSTFLMAKSKLTR